MPWIKHISRRSPKSLILSQEAAALLTGYARVGYPEETGGILIGRAEPRCILMTHVVGPGHSSTRAQNRFGRDGHYAQQELDRIFVKTDGKSDYIGEWHSHPVSSPPSVVDRQTIRRISESPGYATPLPVLVIVQHDLANQDWITSGFMWKSDRLVSIPVATKKAAR